MVGREWSRFARYLGVLHNSNDSRGQTNSKYQWLESFYQKIPKITYRFFEFTPVWMIFWSLQRNMEKRTLTPYTRYLKEREDGPPTETKNTKLKT